MTLIDFQSFFKMADLIEKPNLSNECDWKTSFGPEEIVYAISDILEKNPQLVK